MNARMSKLLNGSGISAASVAEYGTGKLPKLIQVEDSVLLENEYLRSKGVRLSDFPDRTGYEAFVNHVHLPYNGSTADLKQCLGYVAGISQGLAKFADNRRFEIVMSLSQDGCIVRFHRCRPHENLLAPDLEGYLDEAILVLTTGGG